MEVKYIEKEIHELGYLIIADLKRDWKSISMDFRVVYFQRVFFLPSLKLQRARATWMYEVLQNPAMISIVGPTPIDVATDYTVGALYSHTMLLFWLICYDNVSITYNRTYT